MSDVVSTFRDRLRASATEDPRGTAFLLASLAVAAVSALAVCVIAAAYVVVVTADDRRLVLEQRLDRLEGVEADGVEGCHL